MNIKIKDRYVGYAMLIVLILETISLMIGVLPLIASLTLSRVMLYVFGALILMRR